MKMYIHSSYGVLDCSSMTLQAIENSIPELEPIEQNNDLQGSTDGAESTESSASEKLD